MAKRHKLKVPDETVSFLRSLHPEIKRKIKAGLSEIMDNPESGKALRDELDGLRSMRVGRFRIIYRAGGEAIEVVAVGPRRTIYEETYRLVKRPKRGGP